MTTRSEKNGFSVLIPDGGETHALSAIRSLAEEKNIKTYVLGNDKKDSIRYSRHVSKYFPHNPEENKDAELNTILEKIKETQADVLLPVGIKAIRLVSESRKILSKHIAIAPVPEVHSFDIADDKWLLSQWLKENSLPHPTTSLFRPTDNLNAILPSISFPIIMKPRNGSGGNGIFKFESASQLEEWYAGFEHHEDQIIQSYIKGYDIDCSILSIDGKILAHTIQKSIKYSADYPWPHGLEFLHHDEIYSIVEELAKKFHWSGVVHIDLRYDEIENKAKVIEMNPRFWASVTASVFAGVNFPYLSCLSALGMEFPLIRPKNKIILRTGPAIKSTLGKLFRIANTQPYDNSFFEFILKDPLPNLIDETRYYFSKFQSK